MTSHAVTVALARQRADEIARRATPVADAAPAARAIVGILLAIAIGAPIGS